MKGSWSSFTIILRLQLIIFFHSDRTRVASSFSIPSSSPFIIQKQQQQQQQPFKQRHVQLSSSPLSPEDERSNTMESDDEFWESSLGLSTRPYVSFVLKKGNGSMDSNTRTKFIQSLLTSSSSSSSSSTVLDPLWEQVKLEALHALGPEPQAGPQLYQMILSQPSLLEAMVHIVANEIFTELIPATSLRTLFLDMLTPIDERRIQLDIMATAIKSPSIGSALTAILFHRGLHALLCYRVGHRLWSSQRTALSYYLQSTVSSIYSADIHPAATIGPATYLHCGSGVVIGETARIGSDVTILQGVTLGGTGKERGDRHPKVGNGVILHDSATVLGNIKVNHGAVVTAKSIVTKPVPEMARVSGVPAKVKSQRPGSLPLYYGNGMKTTIRKKENDDESEEVHLRDWFFDLDTSSNDDDDELNELESQLRMAYVNQWKHLIPMPPLHSI